MLASLLPKIPLYWSFYRFGFPKLLPFSIVVSVSFRCNSKCRTCDVWRKPNDDLTLDEWTRVFQHIGKPIYLTFTGGEPFLRKDLPEIVLAAYRTLPPRVHHDSDERHLDRTHSRRRREDLRERAASRQIGINLSLDGIGAEHDDIRLVPGNWDKAMETWKMLNELKQRTHESRAEHSHRHLAIQCRRVSAKSTRACNRSRPIRTSPKSPKSASNSIRSALNITPLARDYAPIADFLSERAHATPARGFARITQSFRARYYQLAKRTLLEQRQIIPCFAGWASGHIAPNGDVWSCCIRAEPIGNLRQTNYDLKPIWFEQVGIDEKFAAQYRGGRVRVPDGERIVREHAVASADLVASRARIADAPECVVGKTRRGVVR